MPCLGAIASVAGPDRQAAVIKTVDDTNTTNVEADDSELFMTLLPNAIYEIECVLMTDYTGSSGTVSMFARLGFTGTITTYFGSAERLTLDNSETTTTTGNTLTSMLSSGATITNQATVGYETSPLSTTHGGMAVRAILQVGASSGVLSVKFRRGANVGTARIYAGSFMRARVLH